MGNSVLIGKLGLAVVGILAMLLSLRCKRLFEVSERRFGRYVLAGLVLSRVGAFVLIFCVLRLSPQSDVNTYFGDARNVLAHLVPFRDFDTAYAPLFPYLCAALVKVWNSAKVLVLASALLDVICGWLWWGLSARLFDSRTARTATLLYVCSPFVLINTTIMGQNQVWLAVILGFAILLQLKSRDFASGVVYGCAVVCLKVLAIVFAPILFIAAAKRLNWLVGFALLPVIVYGAFGHFASVHQLLYFTRLAPSSGNVFFLLDAIGLPFNASSTNLISTIVSITALAALFLWAAAKHGRFDGLQLNTMLVLVLLTMLMLSRKSLTNYVAIVFFPMCVIVGSQITRRRIWALAVFTFLLILEPGIYFRFMELKTLSSLWAGAVTKHSRVFVASFAFIDLVLLCMYAYYIRFGLRLICRKTGSGVDEHVISAEAKA